MWPAAATPSSAAVGSPPLPLDGSKGLGEGEAGRPPPRQMGWVREGRVSGKSWVVCGHKYPVLVGAAFSTTSHPESVLEYGGGWGWGARSSSGGDSRAGRGGRAGVEAALCRRVALTSLPQLSSQRLLQQRDLPVVS